MREFVVSMLLLLSSACGWPRTDMVPGGDATARAKPVVTAAPAFTAGPTTARTYAPDGSTTVFVCANGSLARADRVAPGPRPPC